MAPYSHHQLGRMERAWGGLHCVALAIMSHARVPRRLWTTSFSTAQVLGNVQDTPVAGPSGGTPYFYVHGTFLDLSVLRVYGGAVYVTLPAEARRKFEPKARRLVFSENSENSLGYLVYNLRTRTLLVSRHVAFDETSSFPFLEPSGTVPEPVGPRGGTSGVSDPATDTSAGPSGTDTSASESSTTVSDPATDTSAGTSSTDTGELSAPVVTDTSDGTSGTTPAVTCTTAVAVVSSVPDPRSILEPTTYHEAV